MSFMVWHLTVRKSPGSVMVCVGLAFAVTLALTLYAVCTKTDFTMCTGMMIVLAVIALVLSITSIFMQWVAWWHPFVAAILLVIYSVFLIYDTQLIVGKGKHSISMDDYIMGAMILYVDIITIFVEMLSICGTNE